MIGVYLAIQVGCACGRSVPVNGLTTHVHCPACGETVDVPLTRWKSLLDNSVKRNAPLGKTEKVFFAFEPSKFTSGREDPRCGSCKAPMPDEAIAFAARGHHGAHAVRQGDSRDRPRRPAALHQRRGEA